MRPAQRFRLAGAAVAAVEVALGALLTGTILASYFWACAAATLALALIAARFLHTPPRRPGDDPGGPGPPDPPWWPDFERRLHEYSQRSREPAPRG